LSFIFILQSPNILHPILLTFFWGGTKYEYLPFIKNKYTNKHITKIIYQQYLSANSWIKSLKG